MKTIIGMASAACMQRVQDRWIANEVELQRFATLVKAARDAELVAGVEMPEPAAFRNLLESGSHTYCKTAQFFDNAEGVYTADQLRSAVAAAVLRKDAEIADLKVKVVTLWAERHPASEVAELKAELAQRDAHIVEYNTRIQAEVLKLLTEKDEYQRAADDMAMAHKLERDTLLAENERLRDLMGEAASNCKASIAEDGISDARRVYRAELLHRLDAAMKGQP